MTAGTTPREGAAPQTNGTPASGAAVGGPAAASASTDRNLLYIEGGRLIDGVIAGVFDKLGIGHPYAHLFRNEGLKLMKVIEKTRGVRPRFNRSKEAIKAGFLASLIVYPEAFGPAYDQIAEGSFVQLLPLLTRGVEGMIDMHGL